MGQLAKPAPPLLDAGRLFESAFTALRRDPDARLQAALIVSFLLHLFLMVGVGVQSPARKADRDTNSILVELVNSQTAQAPRDAQVRAQANLDGGGNTDEDRIARSPLPASPHAAVDPDASVRMRRAAPVEQPQPQKRLMTQQKAAPAVAQPEPKPAVEAVAEAPPPEISASELLTNVREDERLRASIARQLDAQQKRPKKMFIGAQTREYRFSRYLEDWRLKIERIGDLNYPTTARGIYGRVEVTVTIRANGTLDGAEVTRSSGKKVLDEGAIRIIQLAAPFAAFPPDIAKDVDILGITRTINFTRADRVEAD